MIWEGRVYERVIDFTEVREGEYWGVDEGGREGMDRGGALEPILEIDVQSLYTNVLYAPYA